MISFLHVYLRPKTGTPESSVLEKMNIALDWYRYSDTNWVIKTNSDITKWQARLKPLVDDKSGFLFIVEINLKKRQGWMPSTFWAWCRGEEVETSKNKRKVKQKK